MNSIDRSLLIAASPREVWDYLTVPELMVRWTGEPEMKIAIETDWTVGSPIVFKGFHHVKFENRGKVLQFEPYKIIQYTHLSSVSRLPDVPESYTVYTFTLTPGKEGTLLAVHLENFPKPSSGTSNSTGRARFQY